MRTRSSYYRTLIAESEALSGLTTPTSLEGSLGDLPLIVLSAGRAEQSSFLPEPRQVAAWRDMQAALASLSTVGVQRDLDCGHDIPIACPTDVATAIEALVR